MMAAQVHWLGFFFPNQTRSGITGGNVATARTCEHGFASRHFRALLRLRIRASAQPPSASIISFDGLSVGFIYLLSKLRVSFWGYPLFSRCRHVAKPCAFVGRAGARAQGLPTLFALFWVLKENTGFLQNTFLHTSKVSSALPLSLSPSIPTGDVKIKQPKP